MTRALVLYPLDIKQRERTINLFLFQEIKLLQTAISEL